MNVRASILALLAISACGRPTTALEPDDVARADPVRVALPVESSELSPMAIETGPVASIPRATTSGPAIGAAPTTTMTPVERTVPTAVPATVPTASAPSPPEPPCWARTITGAGFAPESAALSPTTTDQLDQVVADLAAASYSSVIVSGHADARPSVVGNDQLSLDRAETVIGYLIAAGVPAGMLVVQGFGDSVPLVHGDTEAAWAMNRRVEITVLC